MVQYYSRYLDRTHQNFLPTHEGARLVYAKVLN